jgi:hypothetical protein
LHAEGTVDWLWAERIASNATETAGVTQKVKARLTAVKKRNVEKYLQGMIPNRYEDGIWRINCKG